MVEETDRTTRRARVDRLAVDVFGDAERAHRWMRKPKRMLRGETPLAYIATEASACVVEEMLQRIDHGILA